MLIKKIVIQNVRSFLDREELLVDDNITIIIGPNGGGKTNLLDTIVIMLQRHLFSSMYAVNVPTADNPDRYEFRHNDALNNMVLDKHTDGMNLEQLVEISVQVTKKDMNNMNTIKTDAESLIEKASRKYINLQIANSLAWDLTKIKEKTVFTYRVLNGGIQNPESVEADYFLQYLRMFEMVDKLREEYELEPLAMPLVYLPVNRSASGFQSHVELAGYNDFETKRHSNAASSRNQTSIVSLAIGRLAQKFRLLQEKDNVSAKVEFYKNANLKKLTDILSDLGYQWSLETINALKNSYNIRLNKHGTTFLVNNASSGEKELLTYLFAIFALNVRDALIIVDEPELHLHPKWQKTLLQLFIKLSKSTNNQFLFATHSATFISPESISYVSRVYNQNQKSHVARLDAETLPSAKHLLNIVNSQNNERLFFADKVVLVEGLSDRIFFEKLLDHFGRSESSGRIIEVISVGGKGLFEAYKKILIASKISYYIVADFDYIEQVGTADLKKLFKTNTVEIKSDVLENIKSIDGETLVNAIETAIKTKEWGTTAEVWEYIKSKRKIVRKDLSEDESNKLDAFLKNQRSVGVNILREGNLESYLPDGYLSKDLEKLIKLLSTKVFWEKIPKSRKKELRTICANIIKQN
ncbi:AAA family ATPase [Methylotenera sp. 1P/1]|uniref:AAA family ATPase n=1 Tax=Methylotenera sp. 1P/1 TaxID=1131551 RepID=UPI000361B985|nr:AAA family ATPase [Methylotenera sp. 1P/1]